ncbi:MAG: hypothetical protein E6G85_12675 [Alphaproteobacteria bacterium]|nr:MAG: hypothetical protein E6G85_12675 [Alphaproteobacteria bacterium]
MRVAVIVVTMLVATTPSQASESCMSKAEARQHFPTLHIYWHGPDHCWGAMPAGSHPIHQVRPTAPSHEVQREIDQPKIDQPKVDQPTWRDSMSAMLPDDDPMGASRDARPDANDDAAAPTRWGDRWVEIEQAPLAARSVDIAQVASPMIERKSEAWIALRGLVLVLIGFALILGAIVLRATRAPQRPWFEDERPVHLPGQI